MRGLPPTCVEVQRRLSLDADGDSGPDIGPDGKGPGAAPWRAHVRGCGRCSSFAATVADIRHQLRVEGLDRAPDVTGAVLAALPAGRRSRPGHLRRGPARRMVPVAAAFVVGCLAGAGVVVIGDDGSGPVSAAPLAELVRDAQHRVTSLSAVVEMVERGWHPDVPERTFTGTLRYRAPESLALSLDDTTAYPSAAWTPDDVALVVDDDRWWATGPRDCPVAAQPGCTPASPDLVAVEHREPFAESSPVPLELVTPVTSFGLAAGSAAAGSRTIEGRTALGTTTTAGQLGGVLDGLAPAGNLRQVHPSDPVELWLDADSLVPLTLTVRAAESPDRQRWAANRGYRDDPGDTVVDVRLRDVVVNGALPPASFPDAPPGARLLDGGFADEAIPADPGGAPGGGIPGAGRVDPAALPPSLRPHRSGTAGADRGTGEAQAGPGAVSVHTWTDGRAWLKVRSSASWDGGRLFGELGALVRPVELPGAGVAYVSEGGSRVGLHGQGVDVVVSGSLAPAELRRAAAGLGVTGLPVPSDWAEAATTTLEALAEEVPGLLVAAVPPGFAAPAARRDGDVVTLAFTGSGERGFLVVADATGTLLAPSDPDVAGVRVRGRDGRWNPGRGELEWVEDGTAYALASRTLSLAELLAVAASMEPRA